ncbi:FACT complex subunit like [Actinidia chinensis var. chinensis]|uniref:FACT complex subunit like n=1 Tax=Actinidia chinensis var. chinensis TaxID=1590841 RepID=A0A2R6RFT0_ACTCC|nr:FACT complex subunit like [Actinidia chinensis var. chinensis]
MRCEKVRPVNEINGSHSAGDQNFDAGGNSAPQEIASQASLVDGFYEKLSKSFESSGLSLLCLPNPWAMVGQQLLVLYRLPDHWAAVERLLFLYCPPNGWKITKDGKWGEVASTLNCKNSVSMSPTQLHKLYAQLLYQFELTYHYRTLAKVVVPSDTEDYDSSSKFNGIGHPYGTENSSSCSTGKRKHCDNSHLSIVLFGPNDCPTKKKKCNENSNRLSTDGASHFVHSLFWIAGPKLAAQKPDLQTSPKNNEMKKDPNAAIGSRSAYQMYLRKESDRLKKILRKTSGSHNIRNMAIDAWSFSLRAIDRVLNSMVMETKTRATEAWPYVEESRKDKERYNREMTAYKERKNMEPDGDYCVILQPATEKFFVPDASAVELASRLMKNAQPNNLLLQINWDEYCGSLYIPILNGTYGSGYLYSLFYETLRMIITSMDILCNSQMEMAEKATEVADIGGGEDLVDLPWKEMEVRWLSSYLHHFPGEGGTAFPIAFFLLGFLGGRK